MAGEAHKRAMRKWRQARSPHAEVLSGLERAIAAHPAGGRGVTRRADTKNVTHSNFIDIAYLLPRLLTAQEQAIAALSADIALIHDVEAKQQLEALMAVKRLSLAGLAALSSSHPHPASA